MRTEVDLRDLAIDRGGTGPSAMRTRRHLLTRYCIPLALIFGFLSLVIWASWTLVFPPKPVTVVPVFSTTAEVRREGTPLFKAAGWIEPRPTPVRVAALAPGVVEQLLVVEDQPVRAGEPIAELVKEDARLAHERARADLQLRQAEIDEAQAALTAAETRLEQPVHLQAALGEAEASLARTETQLKNLPFEQRRAAAEYEALQKSYDGKRSTQGVVAGIDIDLAKSKAESAKALVEELRDRAGSLEKEQAALTKRRDALQTQLELLADEIKAKEEAEAKLEAAKARVQQARVAVAETKLRLERTTIRAPIEGRVFRLIAHPGTHLSAGMGHTATHDASTVVTLYQPDMLQARVDVRFENIPQVRLQQPVQIDNPALEAPITGKVLFVSSEADIQKNTLEVKVEIPVPPPVFKPEMLVDVTFLAPEQPKATGTPAEELKLYVPQQLLRRERDESFVWVADRSEGVARKTKVETGAVGSGGLVEITSGLTVSSRIIARGGDGLQDGDRIHIAEEDISSGAGESAALSGTSRTIERLPTGDEP